MKMVVPSAMDFGMLQRMSIYNKKSVDMIFRFSKINSLTQD